MLKKTLKEALEATTTSTTTATVETKTVMLCARMPLAARASLRQILARHPERQMQDLIEEAMNDLFAKYRVPEVAALPRDGRWRPVVSASQGGE